MTMISGIMGMASAEYGTIDVRCAIRLA